MKRLVYFLIYFVIVICGVPSVNAANDVFNKENRTLLLTLDSVLTKAPGFNAEKEKGIQKLREAYRRASDGEHRYWLATNLYDEYAAFNSDSAMRYVNVCSQLARRLDRSDMIVDVELNRVYLLSATGLLDDAASCLEKIKGMPMNERQKCNFVDRSLFLNTHRRQYIGSQEDKGPYSQSVDSLIRDCIVHITPDNPNYSWIVGWGNLTSRKDALRAIEVIRPQVDESKFQTRRDAMNAWVLSKLYDYCGDQSSKLKYLLLSAISDVRGGVKEMASLQEVAQILLDNGDFQRANEYINYCFHSAIEYKSRVRMEAIASLKEQAMGQIIAGNERKTAQNRTLVISIGIIALVLLVALVYIVRQMRLLKRSRMEIGVVNEDLQNKVLELERVRGQLQASQVQLQELYAGEKKIAKEMAELNDLKEGYIANIFALCSNYITKLDDFRKNIGALAKEKKYDELRELTRNPELSYAEVKELYANFDRMLLDIYPDFVAHFNQLLRPEERIELKNPNVLTTELRIYALVRLGLTDSVKIARFLHVSVQTVYNTRQRTRNKALGPRENFAYEVAHLGKTIL